jgi:hypothetical protein
MSDLGDLIAIGELARRTGLASSARGLDTELATAILSRYPSALALSNVTIRKLAGLCFDGRRRVGYTLARELIAAAKQSVRQSANGTLRIGGPLRLPRQPNYRLFYEQVTGLFAPWLEGNDSVRPIMKKSRSFLASAAALNLAMAVSFEITATPPAVGVRSGLR